MGRQRDGRGPAHCSLKLTTPLGGFLQAATQPIAPAHLLAGIPPDALPDDPFGSLPIGSGPFRLVFLEAGRASLAAATPVEPDTDPGGPNFDTPPSTDSLATARPTVRADAAIPYIGRFELRYFDDIESLIDAWAEGELDAVSGFQPGRRGAPRRFRSLPGNDESLRRTSTSGPVGASSGPQGPRSSGYLDRDAIVRRAGGLGSRDLLIPPSFARVRLLQEPGGRLDNAAARASLRPLEGEDAAGTKDAKDPIVIELLQPEERNPVAYATSKHIVASWHAVGLAVRHVPLPASSCSTPPGRG